MTGRTTMDGGERRSRLDCFIADEILVAQVLLDLPEIIRDNNSCSILKWGSKMRRSKLDDGAPSACAPSSHPSPSFQKIEARTSKSKATTDEDDGASASPVTPLSFAPCESDEKKSRNCFRKKCTKREIVNVTKHYNKLKSYNSELKTMKKEIRVESIHQPLVPMGPVTAQFYPSQVGLGSVHGAGPLGLPHPNTSAGQAFGLYPSGPLNAIKDQIDRRGRFAEARRLRKGIIKIKSMRRACGVKLPVTRWHL